MLGDLNFECDGFDVLFDGVEDSDGELNSDDSASEPDDNIKKFKRNRDRVYQEKKNIFLEENAPFPMPSSPVSAHIDHDTGSFNDTKDLINFTYGHFSKFPSSSELSQNIGTQTVVKTVSEGPADHHGANHSFTTSRPQEAEFRYGQNSSLRIAPVKEEIRAKIESESVKSGDKKLCDPENINNKKLKDMKENEDKLFDPCQRSPPEDHHKLQEEKRLRYGCSNSSVEKKTKKKKSNSQHGMSNVEQDERLKQSTSESDSSVEYLVTASSASSQI